MDINFDKGTLLIPKGVGKTRYRDEELAYYSRARNYAAKPIRYWLAIQTKKVEHYKMIPWLFGTRAYKFERYWDKKI